METTLNNTAVVLQDRIIEEIPFVNDECGDTMWDEVLKNMEDKKDEA